MKPITATTTDMIELFSKALGPGRFARSAYRVREHTNTNISFGFNAFLDDELIGSITLTPIKVGDKSGACLIGPLIVTESQRSQGVGQALIEEGLEAAGEKNLKLAILVGDIEFYQRAGFTPVPRGQILLPGPVATERLLAREIEAGTLEQFKGMAIADTHRRGA